MPEVAEDELREECEVESDEDDQRCEACPAFRIQASGNFRPPEVEAAEISHERAADHDVVEVGDDEVGVGDVDIDAESGQEQSREAAHGEQANEAEGIEHGRVVMDGALVESGGPVEDFDGGGDGDGVAEQREDQRGVDRDAGDEHVVRPDQESEDGDGEAMRMPRSCIRRCACARSRR